MRGRRYVQNLTKKKIDSCTQKPIVIDSVVMMR